MSKSIAVFGAGPALGRAVAHRYATEGYTVVLVARHPKPLHQMGDELTASGATVHAVTADLSDTQAVPRLAEQIRAQVGNLDVLYYGPSGGATPPTGAPMSERLRAFMPLALYTPVALIDEFLPHMIAQRDGAILIATGASAVQGMPTFRAAGPGLAAQRNYLQSLEVELSNQGICVGRLYIGATIDRSAWHARIEADKTAGRPSQARGPVVSPDHLADLLWSMHNKTMQPEVFYPEGLFDQ
jgi:NAD(P)-dependent dehydrogenase (short-subunit alcohol dehydrogenase family)